MPSISAEEAPKLKPFVDLAEKLGSFAASSPKHRSRASASSTRARSRAQHQGADRGGAAGVLRPQLLSTSTWSIAPVMQASGHHRRRGQARASGVYESVMIRLSVTTDMPRSVAGTVFSDGKPRIVEIKGIEIDAEFAPHMLYITNDDKPGFIGRFGTLLGEGRVNIATFHLGRDKPGGDAICFVAVDERISDEPIPVGALVGLVRTSTPPRCRSAGPSPGGRRGCPAGRCWRSRCRGSAPRRRDRRHPGRRPVGRPEVDAARADRPGTGEVEVAVPETTPSTTEGPCACGPTYCSAPLA
jgi:hypothetical protein